MAFCRPKLAGQYLASHQIDAGRCSLFFSLFAGQRLANAAISMRPAGSDSKARAKLPRSADAKGFTAALNLSDPKSAQAGEHYHIWSAMQSVVRSAMQSAMQSAMRSVSQGNVGAMLGTVLCASGRQVLAAISLPGPEINLTSCTFLGATGRLQHTVSD